MDRRAGRWDSPLHRCCSLGACAVRTDMLDTHTGYTIHACVATYPHLCAQMDFRSGLPVPSGARSVFAWGRGAEGQLGMGSLADSGVPVEVTGMQDRTVQQVAGGGVLRDGGVRAW